VLSSAVQQQLRAALVGRAGGYLRNPVREYRVTCATCSRPVADYPRCWRCNKHRGAGELADAVAALTYASYDDQSGYVMRRYKPPYSIAEHQQVVALLGLTGIAAHGACAGGLGPRLPVTHWACVPSLPAKPGVHPLRQLVSPALKGQEVMLTAAAATQDPRAVDVRHFTADRRLPVGSHALVVDDTWTTGGHAQSAVLALRAAGASRVSVLVLARWIDKDEPAARDFVRGLRRDFDPDLCPWTGGACPS
jgi:hypothetical protein